MKKKIIFISVIIAILLIGIAVAGVISKSRVHASDTECGTCNKTYTYTNHSGGHSKTCDCGTVNEEHNYEVVKEPVYEGSQFAGVHTIRCVCGSTQSETCDFTVDYLDLSSESSYLADYHRAWCECGAYQSFVHNYNVIKGPDEDNPGYHKLECICGNDSGDPVEECTYFYTYTSTEHIRTCKCGNQTTRERHTTWEVVKGSGVGGLHVIQCTICGIQNPGKSCEYEYTSLGTQEHTLTCECRRH